MPSAVTPVFESCYFEFWHMYHCTMSCWNMASNEFAQNLGLHWIHSGQVIIAPDDVVSIHCLLTAAKQKLSTVHA